MYSPYLFARRHELLALRELLVSEADASLKRLLPVLEPVKADAGDLHRCMNAFAKKNTRLIVITNPSKHEFAATGASKQLRDSCKEIFATYPLLMPGYVVSASMGIEKVEKFVEQYDGRNVALVYDSPSFTSVDLQKVASLSNVRYQVVVQQSLSKSQINLIPSARLVDTRDHFNRLPRNSDYKGQEFFTDRHLSKKSTVLGDYTILGRTLEVGGGKPGAVVIHASYKHPETGDIWLEHFGSDQIHRDEGTPEGKFLQAAKKLVRAVKQRPTEFGHDQALDYYASHVAKSTFPGLGKNKQYQIMHHIHLMLAGP